MKENTTTPKKTAPKIIKERKCPKCKTVLIIKLSVLMVILAIIFIRPCPINPKPYNISDTVPIIDPSQLTIVNNSTFQLEHLAVSGSETIVRDSMGNLITGKKNGVIVKISPDFKTITPIIRIGIVPLEDSSCDDYVFPNKECGWPLGITFKDDNNIFVIDAFSGIYLINLLEKTKSTIFDINNSPIIVTYPNSLVYIVEENTIYFTDSSQHHPPSKVILNILEHPSDGSLLKLNLDTNKLTVLATNFHVANGLEIHRDGESLIMCELMKARIWRYHFRGEKIGKMEIFAENLIGLPDNIFRASDTGYWVGSSYVWPEDSIVYLLKRPFLCCLPVRIFSAEFISMIGFLGKGNGNVVIKINENGVIEKVFYDASGDYLQFVTGAIDTGGYLYVGSLNANSVVRFKL